MTTSKLYHVLLPAGHRAQKDQIVDGHLGDKINGTKAEYTRGEALKKAHAFKGKIVDSGKFKPETYDASVTAIRKGMSSRLEIEFNVTVDINGKAFSAFFSTHREIKNTLGITQKELNSFLKAR